MGCYIHIHMETRLSEKESWSETSGNFGSEKWPATAPFDDRNYITFAFLADVRNYDDWIPCVIPPRGFPKDACEGVRMQFEEWSGDAHTPSWLTLEELMSYDYGVFIKDDEGKPSPLSEWLGEKFFKEMHQMLDHGDPNNVRIVFWFDN